MASPRHLYQLLDHLRGSADLGVGELEDITADDVREVLLLAGDLAPLDLVDTATALAARLDHDVRHAGGDTFSDADLLTDDEEPSGFELGREPDDLDELADLDLDFGSGAGAPAEGLGDDALAEHLTTEEWTGAEGVPLPELHAIDAADDLLDGVLDEELDYSDHDDVDDLD